MAATSVVKSEKERMLDAKMEEMRRKNEDLRRRYEEIEEDKRRAGEAGGAGMSSARKGSGPPPAREISNRHDRRARPRVTDESDVRPRVGPTQNRLRISAKDYAGPPPDPRNPLLDRHESDAAPSSAQGQRTAVRGRGRGRHDGDMSRRRYRDAGGGADEKQQMELTMTGKERRQYVEWRAERDQIDAERLERAKSATGQWRREWDVEKATAPAEPFQPSQQDTRSANSKQDGDYNRRFERRGVGGAKQAFSGAAAADNRRVELQGESLQILVCGGEKTNHVQRGSKGGFSTPTAVTVVGDCQNPKPNQPIGAQEVPKTLSSSGKPIADAQPDKCQAVVGTVEQDTSKSIQPRISDAEDDENQWEDVEDEDEEQCESQSPPYVEAVEEEQYFSPEPEEETEVGFHTDEFDAIERKMREDLERNEEAMEAAFKESGSDEDDFEEEKRLRPSARSWFVEMNQASDSNTKRVQTSDE